MASFKYKNIQQFVKQTIYPFIVNIQLLIRDITNNIFHLDNTIKENTQDLNNKISNTNSIIGSSYIPESFNPTTGNHEVRLVKVENLGVDHTEKISKINTDISGINSEISTMKSNISTNVTNISTNKTDIQNLSSNYTAHANDKTNPHEVTYTGYNNGNGSGLADVVVDTKPLTSIQGAFSASVRVYDQIEP